MDTCFSSLFFGCHSSFTLVVVLTVDGYMRIISIQADVNEPGEYLAQILTDRGVSNFQGYKNTEATNKKIARDVVKKGETVICLSAFGTGTTSVN